MRQLHLLILALLLAAPASGQFVTNRITGSGGGGGGGGGAAPDWGPNFVAWWNADNTAEATAGSCTSGTDCDLSASGGATFDATNVWEGTHSFTLDGVGDLFSCTNATCDEIAQLTGSVSGVCAARPTTGNPNSNPAAFNWLGGNLGGARMGLNSSDQLLALVGDGTDAEAETGTTTSLTLDAWNHIGFSYEDAGAITIYLSGANVCVGGCATQPALAASTGNFEVGRQATQEWQGQLDECGIYAGVIGPESMCRICSCGIDGSQCTISGTSFTDTGRNAASCGSCTLPTDASQATPGTN